MDTPENKVLQRSFGALNHCASAKILSDFFLHRMKNVFYVNKIYYYTLSLYLMSDTTAHKGGAQIIWENTASPCSIQSQVTNISCWIRQRKAIASPFQHVHLFITCLYLCEKHWHSNLTSTGNNFFFIFVETHLCSSGNQYKKSASKLRTEQHCTGLHVTFLNFFTGIFVHRARSLYFLYARRSKSRWTPWTRMHRNV